MSGGERDIVCVLTPTGRGAVAVVGVDGPTALAAVDRFFRAANGRQLAKQPLDRIVYGYWAGAEDGNSPGEDLVVCRRSATKLEIHCHGGTQSSAQIVNDLTAADCEALDQIQWLQHEYACPLQAAAHEALTQTTTFRTASILLDQYYGALRNEITGIVADLKAACTNEAKGRLEQLLALSEFGVHLTKPWQVVIAGQPNVGKSSLINALVGFERAIVFDQPGTTRDVVTATTAVDGWPIALSDTAGLHETSDTIEAAGIQLARERLAAADLVVWVFDAVELIASGETDPWHLVQQQAEAVGVEINLDRTVLVVNKIDLTASKRDLGAAAVATCAVSTTGIEALLRTIAQRLVPQKPSQGAAVPFQVEQIEQLRCAAVSDREAALAILKQLLDSH